MKIVWIGCHEEGLKAFCSVLESGRRIDAFITLEEQAFQKRSAGSRDYLSYCKKYNIPYYEVDTIKGDKAFDIISEINPDLIVVLGWSELLPETLLDIPAIGTVGTHASLLPHNRGSAPINWALIKGEEKTGNTMMWLSKEVDSGDIIDQMEIPISPYDTCKTLYDQVATTNAVMLMRLLENLDNGKKPVSDIKNEIDEEILPRRRPKDGIIDWNQSGEQIYNFIRALTVPYPGAFSFLNGKKIVIWEAALLPWTYNELTPGEIVGNTYSFNENCNGIIVATKTNMLMITQIEDEDGNIYGGEKLNNLGLKGLFTYE